MQINKYLNKLLADPFGTLERGLYKTIIGPLKYRTKNGDYDAEKYWRDRLDHYQFSYKGAGEEGLSERENDKRYTAIKKTIHSIITRGKYKWGTIKVLDIGC